MESALKRVCMIHNVNLWGHAIVPTFPLFCFVANNSGESCFLPNSVWLNRHALPTVLPVLIWHSYLNVCIWYVQISSSMKVQQQQQQQLQVYIDIGAVGDKHGQLPPSYGTLLRPTEEGRAGDRVARAARFMGTYQEFKNHCRDLPGLLRPHVALWADVFWLATGHCPSLSGARGRKKIEFGCNYRCYPPGNSLTYPFPKHF